MSAVLPNAISKRTALSAMIGTLQVQTAASAASAVQVLTDTTSNRI